MSEGEAAGEAARLPTDAREAERTAQDASTPDPAMSPEVPTPDATRHTETAPTSDTTPQAPVRQDLEAQMAFLQEADRLKSVLRASRLCDGSRHENSAEHSWHLALFALVLGGHAAPGVNVDRVIRMALIHDLVEIDAGDAPLHGDGDKAVQAAAERAAADRLFGMLPVDQGAEFRALWDEFEAGETADAIFARALDRAPAPMQNLANGGGTWADYAVTMDQIDTRVGTPIGRGAPALWAWLRPRIARHLRAD